MIDPSPSGPSTGDGFLRREVGLPGAILLGLGSMVGTGVFVSIGIAAGVAGPSLLMAILLAAVLATANGLSSAQLSAAHPVSGGTYEYGYRWLSPAWGFTAGWMFLLAKSASAATAALGLSGYLLERVGVGGPGWRVAVAVGGTLAITAFVAGGIRRSNRGNALIVGVTLSVLILLILAAMPVVVPEGLQNFRTVAPDGAAAGSRFSGWMHGTALMFVAFTGYGRIATMGEEVRDPGRVIPRAVVWTMGAATVLYLGVAIAGVGVLGPDGFADATAETAVPLEALAAALGRPLLPWVVALAAVTAMAGVLLNLVLGLSRVALAMARRGDAPRFLRAVDRNQGSPVAAVWACGGLVAVLALVGDVRVTWAFSAFTVLLYYGITNLAALRLPPAARRFPRWVAWAGLVGCVGLAFWVDREVWTLGLGLLVVGLAGHFARRRWGRRNGSVGGA